MKHKQLHTTLLIVLSIILVATLAMAVGCNKKADCTVTFDSDGGVAVQPKTVKQNSEIGELPTTSKDGYDFLGWAEEKGGTTFVSEHYVVAKDVTLFAVFKKTQQSTEEYYTITFSTSGTAVNVVKVKKGDAIGALPFTDKRGYAFSGWFFDQELTNPAFSEDVITQDVTLYAAFEKQDVDSVLPEYSELSISTDNVNYAIQFESDETIDERNIKSFISVTALYGELPKTEVISRGNGKYTLSPIGGYKNGGVYKIEINDDRVSFVELDVAHNDDYTDDKAIKIVYLSLDAAEEELVSVKNGIVELNASSVVFESENMFTAPKSIYDKLPFDNDSVVRIVDGDTERYIKLTKVEQAGDKYEFSFVDCDDVDEVYEDFNINVSDISVTNEKTTPENKSETDSELAEIERELYTSKGTEAITAMLANALNASPTVQSLTSSQNPYRDNITDVSGKTFTIDGLLEDLQIKVTLGTARNSSFNGIGISPLDDTRWTMLAIQFSYETDIKNHVKLEATITITQYLYVGLASSANKSTGDFKAEITPYSQTDIDFQILVCSTSEDDDDKDDDKKQEKKDISVEIENLANGEGDSSNIIKDVQEMLENKGDAIELCKVPMFSAAYTVGGVISINIDLNFVIKVSFAAGVKINATLLEATTIGVTGNYKTKTVDCYRRSAMGSDRYIFDFYAYGYLGVKAGIEGELSVSFIGLKQVLRAGVGIEVGAYADLYGYLHYHAEERRVFKDIDTNGRHFQTLEGGVYFESGIYLELKAFVGVGKKEYGVSKEFKFKLLEAGDKYLYVEACENDDLTIIFNENDENSVSLEDLIPAEGKFMDITTGEIETRVIPSKNIKLISNTNLFKVDNVNKLLAANMDKIEKRLPYGIPYGTISLYYKGPNILFASSYLNENIPELKGFKELCKVTVVYLQEGTKLDDTTGFGKELTVTYKVRTESGEETVKTEKVISGQYYKGGIPDEIVAYCRQNGLLSEPDGKVVSYNGPTSGKHILTENATYVFNTTEAQRFVAVRYKSQQDFASDNDTWTVDIMAMNYNDLPTILDKQKYTPQNIFYEFFVVTPDGNRKVMGNEYLSKYDLYMRGTYGFETGTVLETVQGTKQKLDSIFADMKNGTGILADYSEFFTFTMEAEYITGMHTVHVYAPNGESIKDNAKYGEMYKVPEYWITNINQSTSQKLAGWDTNGDKVADILPNEQFTVTSDMVLRPVMTALGYTVTVVDFDGNTTITAVDAGSAIPQKILDVINSDPGTVDAPEGSFYSKNQWRIITTDFVTGNDNSAYFRGVSMRYNGDITTMPACDIVITGVRGDLYHYVTIIDQTNGHFTYKNDDGQIVEAKTVKIAVKDGGTVGASEDYKAKEIKYHAPADVTYYSASFTADDGEVLDLFNTAIIKANTYNHTTWERRDGTYAVLFKYCLSTNGNVSYETKRNIVGITDEVKLKELIDLCDKEYKQLTSKDYCDSLSNDEFDYSIDESWCVNGDRFPDGYGITHITYIVYMVKRTKTYTVSFDYDTPSYVNHTDSVKYGNLIVVPTATKEVEGEDEWGKYVDYYKIIGFDTDGDGIADVMPNEFVTITKDTTFKAIYEDKPYSRSSR